MTDKEFVRTIFERSDCKTIKELYSLLITKKCEKDRNLKFNKGTWSGWNILNKKENELNNNGESKNKSGDIEVKSIIDCIDTLFKSVVNVKKDLNLNYDLVYFWRYKESNSVVINVIDSFLENRSKLIENTKQRTALKQKVIELYESGEYKKVVQIIDDKSNVAMLADSEIFVIYAHSLGSDTIKNYKIAYNILNNLAAYTKEEEIDFKTSALSNFRRHIFKNKLSNHKNIQSLVEEYGELYHLKKHYYPAINYAYMVKIANNYKIDVKDSIDTIFKEVKSSINSDKTSKDYQDKYYSGITEIEFKILMDINSKNIKNELGGFLEGSFNENITPLIERTLRQMTFYRDTMGIELDNLNEAIKYLQGHIDNYNNQKSIKKNNNQNSPSC